MSETTAEVMNTDFVKTLIQQIRAQDTYDVHAKKSNEDLLSKYIVTREDRKKIPIIGDPDSRVLKRLSTFYSAVGILTELRTNIMASPIMQMSDEGFGRLVLTSGRLIVLNRHLRDVHRFGFESLEKLAEEGEKYTNEAVEMIKKYPELANM